MQLAPNSNPITATVISNLEENSLKIVILKLPENVLPAFLSVGKILTAKNQSDASIDFTEGDIISANIEVMGDPFNQVFLLTQVKKEARDTDTN
ncbi:hypothetical protein PW52_08690 [Tamlana sedimentorum]|uniref:Uncharacterized protein n=1 Tax=Neotamlana sedimentorum TaxID=1435349 RepID=A0A0D7W9J2_9FLAO|nr:hypothetical protein [Tamlana sedimentorum]KJD35801.1 hypothetical protein PW52_08690 [Tamlana sedimentorum]